MKLVKHLIFKMCCRGNALKTPSTLLSNTVVAREESLWSCLAKEDAVLCIVLEVKLHKIARRHHQTEKRANLSGGESPPLRSAPLVIIQAHEDPRPRLPLSTGPRWLSSRVSVGFHARTVSCPHHAAASTRRRGSSLMKVNIAFSDTLKTPCPLLLLSALPVASV